MSETLTSHSAHLTSPPPRPGVATPQQEQTEKSLCPQLTLTKVIIDSESPLECEEQTENCPTHSGDIQWCKDQVRLLTRAALISNSDSNSGSNSDGS